ncbi:MAG: hypothetical protein ACREL7_00635 [Longimicrobiales bacterium]
MTAVRAATFAALFALSMGFGAQASAQAPTAPAAPAARPEDVASIDAILRAVYDRAHSRGMGPDRARFQHLRITPGCERRHTVRPRHQQLPALQ